MGSAQEAMAAKRQQQQYTDKARYTEDSSITFKARPADKQPHFLPCNVFRQQVRAALTCATKGVMRAPTLAIPLLVPKPKALVAVGYTCRDLGKDGFQDLN